MRRVGQVFGGLTIALLVVGGPFGYRWYNEKHFRNFREVRSGVLYRSGQLTLGGLERVCHDYGIRTVITLREAHSADAPPPDADEERWCRKMDVRYVRLPPKCWWSAEGPVPADENVRKFLEILDDPKNHPVLIHCFAGAHRTGAYCCVFRMEYDRWANAAALNELYACGYLHLYEEEDVLGYLQNYEPRWKKSEE